MRDLGIRTGGSQLFNTQLIKSRHLSPWSFLADYLSIYGFGLLLGWSPWHKFLQLPAVKVMISVLLYCIGPFELQHWITGGRICFTGLKHTASTTGVVHHLLHNQKCAGPETLYTCQMGSTHSFQFGAKGTFCNPKPGKIVTGPPWVQPLWSAIRITRILFIWIMNWIRKAKV